MDKDDYDYDFFVIGAGSGGVRAARIASQLGARVGVAESGRLGGTCVNVGCVPKKLLVYASQYAKTFADAEGFGWEPLKPEHRWAQLIEAKDREIERLNGVYRRILGAAGVEIVHGRARFLGPHRLQVSAADGDTRELTARYILVATGGRPSVPDIPGADLCITSNEAFYLDSLPRRVAVIGGGYIAVEFAGIFSGLGAQTHLVYRGDLVLRGFDVDVRATLSDELRKSGITVHYNAEPLCFERGKGGLAVVLKDGVELEVDQIMLATGRTPNVEGLDLDAAGVETQGDSGAVVVGDGFASSAQHIFAVGDVTDRIQLTPVAIKEGEAVARMLFGGGDGVVDHSDVPTAVFSQPNVATVGLTEAEARERYHAVDVYRTAFRPMKHTMTGRDTHMLMKLIVDRASDRVVGCHMVGDEAGEIIQGLAVALKAGATKAAFDATVGIHPTAAEEFVTMREPVVET